MELQIRTVLSDMSCRHSSEYVNDQSLEDGSTPSYSESSIFWVIDIKNFRRLLELWQSSSVWELQDRIGLPLASVITEIRGEYQLKNGTLLATTQNEPQGTVHFYQRDSIPSKRRVRDVPRSGRAEAFVARQSMPTVDVPESFTIRTTYQFQHHDRWFYQLVQEWKEFAVPAEGESAEVVAKRLSDSCRAKNEPTATLVRIVLTGPIAKDEIDGLAKSFTMKIEQFVQACTEANIEIGS